MVRAVINSVHTVTHLQKAHQVNTGGGFYFPFSFFLKLVSRGKVVYSLKLLNVQPKKSILEIVL